MIIRKLDIIRFSIQVGSAVRSLMSGYGNPVAAVPVECSVKFETLAELVLCHYREFVTAVIAVLIPAVVEIIELSLRPRKCIVYISFRTSIVIAEIKFCTPGTALSHPVAGFPTGKRRKYVVCSRIFQKVVHVLVPSFHIEMKIVHKVRVYSCCNLT